MSEQKKSVFEVLAAINCNEHTEKKNGLTYLSWAWAWTECKKRFPLAYYTIYENEQGRPYFDDGRTAWVKTGVTIEGLEHIEYLPILDQSAHKSLQVSAITSWDMNKAIQRSLTKALARHGLGLYIYAGEDLPDTEDEKPAEVKKTASRKKAEPAPTPAPAPSEDNDLDLVRQLIREAKTQEELLQLWKDWPEAHEQLKSAFTERRKQLGL
jgi:hypothetical protein